MAEPEKVTPIKLQAEGGDLPIRKLPANLEAEAAFLGAVLIDNRVIEELQVPIRPEHFFEALHARIYERVLTLIERNTTASPVTLRPFFEADEALKELGGLVAGGIPGLLAAAGVPGAPGAVVWPFGHAKVLHTPATFDSVR